MRRAIIAFLLSALVFPGLGQLYNQDRRKGIFLVLGTNALLAVLLVVTLMLLSREYTAVYYPKPLTLEIFQSLLLDTAASPLFWLPFGLLLALWGYAAVDAGRRANLVQKEDS
jgi:Na+-driven multidrug efflux pump